MADQDEKDPKESRKRRQERGLEAAREEKAGRGLLGQAGRAAGLTAAAALAAYGVFLVGAKRSRQRPVTELPNALGMRIEYVPWGDVHYAFYSREGEGRPLVFVHSINVAASAHDMRPLVRALARGDRPIFVLEWVGFGHSDRPEIAYTPEVMEDQLEHFLERVVRPAGGADVIGLSLGATYAAEVARRRPDLVRSLVALEPAGLGDDPGELGRVWSKLVFVLPGVQRALYERLTTPERLFEFARDQLFTPEFGVPEEYVEYGVESARVEGAARPLDDFVNGRLFVKDAMETYLRLRQPLLVVHGTAENRRLSNARRLPELEERPNVAVVSLPTGPLPHWERAAEVADRVRRFYAEKLGDGEQTADAKDA